MSTDRRDHNKESTPREPTLPIEDLDPKKVDGAKADAVKGGAGDLEANSEKIKR